MIEKLKNETPKPLYYMLIIFVSISISVITSLINEDFNNMLTNYVKNPLMNLLGVNFNNEILVFALFLFLSAAIVFTLGFLVYYLKNYHISLTISLVTIGLIGQFSLGSISSQNIDLIKSDNETKTILQTVTNNELGIEIKNYGCSKAYPYVSCGFEIFNTNDSSILLRLLSNSKLYNDKGENIGKYSLNLGSIIRRDQMYTPLKLQSKQSINGYVTFRDDFNKYDKITMMELSLEANVNKKRSFPTIELKNFK